MFSDISIYFACLSVCPFASNKRQIDCTDPDQILRGPQMTPGKVYGTSKVEVKNPRK